MGEWVEEPAHRGKGEGKGEWDGSLWRGNWEGVYHLKYKQIKGLTKKIQLLNETLVCLIFRLYSPSFMPPKQKQKQKQKKNKKTNKQKKPTKQTNKKQ